MEIFRFDTAAGRHVDVYGSDFVVAQLARFSGAGRLAAFHLEAGGLVGRHPAVGNQMVCVVQGDGWAAGEDDRRHRLAAGQAVLWTAGEMHSLGTDSGLVAVVIEGESVASTAAAVGDSDLGE